jgi:hypothetical protein
MSEDRLVYQQHYTFLNISHLQQEQTAPKSRRLFFPTLDTYVQQWTKPRILRSQGLIRGAFRLIVPTFQSRANKGPLFPTPQLNTKTGLAATAGLQVTVGLL